MEFGFEAALCVVVGLAFVTAGAFGFAPAGEMTIASRLADSGDAPATANVTEYEKLPRSAQSVVDTTIREEYAITSSYEDYEAVRALRGQRFVRKDGTVYHIQTGTADGAGNVFGGLLRNVLLATGGLCFGAAAFFVGRGRRVGTPLGFPLGGAAAVLVANAHAAPAFAAVRWFGDASFGLAASVPILVGLAAARRDRPVALAALLAVGCSYVAARTAPGGSLLPVVAPLVLLGIPGLIVGWQLGEYPAERA